MRSPCHLYPMAYAVFLCLKVHLSSPLSTHTLWI
ncbi:unnamed protein product [Phytomonas sp. Hart1]|nr:unnamed protein product [Phytomonas sp. Hart1]|eukprot:CCW65949.1 unnamed protein product [Phytomonas sp. isolate Hart1]